LLAADVEQALTGAGLHPIEKIATAFGPQACGQGVGPGAVGELRDRHKRQKDTKSLRSKPSISL
jgi:hypothetical protein